MQNPKFYPHKVQSPIEVLQTHISYIVLTGDYAYKLKKPLDLGFLDFSHLEKRHYYCQQEFDLNQPIAPDIYLDVLPITQHHDTLELNGQGETVEYVVKMRQFPQSALLSEMEKAGELTESLFAELGRIVARFHQNAKTNEYIREFGNPAKIKEGINNNYQQTKQYIGIAQTKTQFQQTQAFTDDFFQKYDALLKARQDNNFIRECHGDLHLKNICYWQEKLQLFDRIEFNEPFRFVDVMYDVAFTVMDLEYRNRTDFANVFLNNYLEYSGDWEGVQVLPLYLTRQAYVRAKVNSFILDDPHVSEAEKQHAHKQASQYYHLAWQYTQSRQGHLWMMSGLSGSGKTTIAREIAKQLQAIHLRSDAVRKQLAGIDLQAQGSQQIYQAEMTQQTYQRLLELGLLLASQGWHIILDAKYDQQSLREAVIQQSNIYQIPVKILHCYAPPDLLRDRVAKRQGDISDATVDLITQQQAHADPFTEREQPYLITLDTRQNWQNQDFQPWLFA